MNMSTSVGLLAAALSAFQGEMGSVAKDRKGQIGAQRYVYADLPAAWDAIREPLTKHGLSVLQPATSVGAEVQVRTLILHVSGEWIDCGTIGVEVIEAPKGITLAQARGSAVTYLRRYGLFSALGLVADDDDGATVGRAGPAPQRQEAQRQPEPSRRPPADDAPPTLEQRRERAAAWIVSQGVTVLQVEGELERPIGDWTPANLDAVRAVVARIKSWNDGGTK